ncbi:hypothetical protein K435DRAFT_928186 [Dendrothele bispora CBS 962.96]|uniref:SHSP domain-containing protein n=1 Tax=Dendrothele bispora (strain CBS 962.96) TaxID=1314807 RepID=A0A4V4HCR5_DENBC|nr:hypothetical protein K435DRAFT_928186 [Dendrothele bispora CBS 962.96]
MSPRGSPKIRSSQVQFPTFQLAPPDNRIIPQDQFPAFQLAPPDNRIITQEFPTFQLAPPDNRIITQEFPTFQLAPPDNRIITQEFGEWMPRVDIWDDPEYPTVIATFKLPGVRPEDLAVHVQDHRYLVVQGQRPCRLGNAHDVSTLPPQPIDAANKLVEGEEDQKSQQQGKFSRAELRYGSFSRKTTSGPVPEGMKKSKERGPSTGEEEEEEEGEVSKILLGITVGDILEGLRTASKFTPVPHLAIAAWLALSIFEALQKAHGNKKNNHALAKECVTLVFTIQVELTSKGLTKENVLLPPDLESHLRSLYGFAMELTDRPFFKRISAQSDDAGAILAYRRELKRVLDTYITICQKLTEVQENTATAGAMSKETSIIQYHSVNSPSPPATSSNPRGLSRHELQASDSGYRRDNRSSTANNVSFFSNASNIMSSGLRITNVVGDQYNISESSRSNITDSRNAMMMDSEGCFAMDILGPTTQKRGESV